jgi:hypothetical protein
VVTQGRYDSADGSQGSPYLADLAEGGTLTKTADLPTHVVLVASEQWLAWIEPGAIGGETLTVERLQVQRIDGSAAAELTPPQVLHLPRRRPGLGGRGPPGRGHPPQLGW